MPAPLPPRASNAHAAVTLTSGHSLASEAQPAAFVLFAYVPASAVSHPPPRLHLTDQRDDDFGRRLDTQERSHDSADAEALEFVCTLDGTPVRRPSAAGPDIADRADIPTREDETREMHDRIRSRRTAA